MLYEIRATRCIHSIQFSISHERPGEFITQSASKGETVPINSVTQCDLLSLFLLYLIHIYMYIFSLSLFLDYQCLIQWCMWSCDIIRKTDSLHYLGLNEKLVSGTTQSILDTRHLRSQLDERSRRILSHTDTIKRGRIWNDVECFYSKKGLTR